MLLDMLKQLSSNNAGCLVRQNNVPLITNAFAGIPETLILNVVAWVILIIIFTILRHEASDYGRLTVISHRDDNRRWMNLFYAQGSEEKTNDENQKTNTTTDKRRTSMEAPADRGFISWILATFRLRKEQILKHSGPDAFHYLTFQQHLIVVTLIMTIISIAVLLPINFHGNLLGEVNTFAHTTISNLHPDSKVLWVHVFCAITFVPLVVVIMRRTLRRDTEQISCTRTLMVTNIHSQDRNKVNIRNHMRKLFPNIYIDEIHLTYNINKLSSVIEEYEKMMEARIYCEAHKERRIVVKVFPEYLTCKTQDGLEYYREQESKLAREVAPLKDTAQEKPLNIAFITVSSVDTAQHILTNFQPHVTPKWKLSFAPLPTDILWENLNVKIWKFYLKWIIVNLILFIFLIFITTPVLIINMLASIVLDSLSPLLSDFLPMLILWLLTAFMPSNIGFFDKLVSHRTRSEQNYSIMIKTFGYLLFLILILPSLGFTSALAFFEWTLHYSENGFFRWECMFMPDSGAFFVNYIITTGFIGTGLELIRFPELIIYTWMLCKAKSQAETPYIMKSIVDEFPFGINYAWMIMVFTISVVYSLTCPLIMPFALIYLLLKHFNDRHNLYFVYRYSNMARQDGGKIHSTAIGMTSLSVVLLLIMMIAVISLRTGGNIDARGIVLMVALGITLAVFIILAIMKRFTKTPANIDKIQGPPPPPLNYTPKVLRVPLPSDPPKPPQRKKATPYVIEVLNPRPQIISSFDPNSCAPIPPKRKNRR